MTSRLKKLTGIGAAVVATLALGWAVWTYIRSPESPPPRTPSFAAIKVVGMSVPIDKAKKHSVRYAEISGMESLDTQARVNHLLKRTALSIYEKYKDWDEVIIDYEVGFTGFNLLAIKINTEIFNEGAAHPHHETKSMVVDLTTVELIELRHLFKPAYKADLNRILMSKLKQAGTSSPCEEPSGDKQQQDAEREVKKALENMFGDEAQGCFSGFKDGWQFYLKGPSVVFVFPKYSIASGASGIVEVGVNFKELRGLLNPNGPIVEAMLVQPPQPELVPSNPPKPNPPKAQSILLAEITSMLTHIRSGGRTYHPLVFELGAAQAASYGAFTLDETAYVENPSIEFGYGCNHYRQPMKVEILQFRVKPRRGHADFIYAGLIDKEGRIEQHEFFETSANGARFDTSESEKLAEWKRSVYYARGGSDFVHETYCHAQEKYVAPEDPNSRLNDDGTPKTRGSRNHSGRP